MSAHNGRLGNAVESFNGSADQYERLRTALIRLHEAAITSGTIERELVALNRGAPTMGRTDIDKFRKGIVLRPRGIDKASALWVTINLRYPQYIENNNQIYNNFYKKDSYKNFSKEEDLFLLLKEYYEASSHRIPRIGKHACGTYKLYHYSSMFNNYSDDLPCAVVVGEFKIEIDDNDIAVIAKETQKYDGSLGRTPITEFSAGCCVPKGSNIYVFMRSGIRKTPKFYIFDNIYYDSESGLTKSMNGYMLSGLDNQGYFHSPVYAIRTSNSEIDCNILRCEDIPYSIMRELNREKVSLRARL